MSDASSAISRIFRNLQQLHDFAVDAIDPSDEEITPTWFAVEAKHALKEALQLCNGLLKDADQIAQLDALQQRYGYEGLPNEPELFEPLARSLYHTLTWVLAEVERLLEHRERAGPADARPASEDLVDIREWLLDAIGEDEREHAKVLAPFSVDSVGTQGLVYVHYASQLSLARARFTVLYDKHEAAQKRIAELEAEMKELRARL